MNKKVFIIALPEEVNHISSLLSIPIIYSGAGKINAAIAAYKAFTNGYKEIINIGSCGSIKHSKGDIIKVGISFQDIDFTPLCPYGETLFESNSNEIRFDSSSLYNCFTTDYFYDHTQEFKYSKDYLNMISKCDIFDMECFAIAKICKEHNMKFSAYKWVSDNGDGSNWKEDCKINLEKIKSII
jgi:adenosylhomocysteine nucleosidase